MLQRNITKSFPSITAHTKKLGYESAAHAYSDCYALIELTRPGGPKCTINGVEDSPAWKVTLTSRKGDQARQGTLLAELTI